MRKERTMRFMQRIIHKVYPGKWGQVPALLEKYDAVESRFGTPPSTRYRSVTGLHDNDTLIVEREFESFAVFESWAEKVLADPEWQAVGDEGQQILKSTHYEMYAPFP
jgi:hypothetical protein